MVISTILKWYQLLHTLSWYLPRRPTFPQNTGHFSHRSPHYWRCILHQPCKRKQTNKQKRTFFEYGGYGTSLWIVCFDIPYNEIRQNRFISELLLYFCVIFMLNTDWSCHSYELNNIRFFLAFMITRITGYAPFARDHNAPCLPPLPPPKFLITIVPDFSWVLRSP